MKIVETYKDFCKIKRKYYKRHTDKKTDILCGKRITSYWEKGDWIGYIIPSYETYTNDKVISKEVRFMIGDEIYNATIETVKKLYKNSGYSKAFTFHYEYQNHQYIDGNWFLGVILTNRDAYYLVSRKKYSKEYKDYVLIPIHWKVDESPTMFTSISFDLSKSFCGHIIDPSLMIDAVNKYQDKVIGSLDHPCFGYAEGKQNLCDVTHRINNVYIKDNKVYTDITILNTPKGNAIKELINSGMKVHASPNLLMNGDKTVDIISIDLYPETQNSQNLPPLEKV